MKDHPYTKTQVTGVAKTLWAARIDATCDQWHLDKAIPKLGELADQTEESRLRHAIEYVQNAHDFFESARGALATALDLVESYTGVQPPQTVNGSKVEPPRTAASNAT
jgi:hypothetical protein